MRLSKITCFVFSVVSVILWHPYIVKPNHVCNPIAPVVWLRLPDSWWVHTGSHLGVWGSNCTIHILPRPCPSLVAPAVSVEMTLDPVVCFWGSPKQNQYDVLKEIGSQGYRRWVAPKTFRLCRQGGHPGWLTCSSSLSPKDWESGKAMVWFWAKGGKKADGQVQRPWAERIPSSLGEGQPFLFSSGLEAHPQQEGPLIQML